MPNIPNLLKRSYTDFDKETPITAKNLNDIQDNIINRTSYVTCSTSASSSDKTAALTDFALDIGASIKVNFQYTNTALNPTLNVNDTGAKPIYTNTGAHVGRTPDTSWAAGEIVELVYDGTNWVRPAGTLGSVGALNDLQTDTKTTIVAAINEVNSHADTANTKADTIGDLSNLETTAKSTIVDAINEVNAETDIIDKLGAVIVTTPEFSTLPQTFTDAQLTFERGSHITTDLICGMCDFKLSNNTAMFAPWTINTEVAGQITISGHIAGTTALKIYFRHQDVAPPEGAVSVDYVGVHSVIKVELTNITSLPVTFTGLTGVTAQHEALIDNYGVITPKSSANGDWSFTCGTESVTISGTFNGSTPTTVKLTLCIPDNKITASATGGE